MSDATDSRRSDYARADALLDVGRTADARAILGRLLAADPGDAWAWCRLATALLREGQAAQAYDAAVSAVRAAPEFDYAHRLRALTLLELGRTEEAAAAAREAMRLDPEDWGNAYVLAHALVGHVESLSRLTGARRRAADLVAEADRAARHAVALAPHEADTHLVLGRVAGLMGHGPLEEAAYREALRLDPGNATALTNLSAVQGNARQTLQATKTVGSALRADPQQDVARRNAELLMLRLLGRVHLATFAAFWFVVRPLARAENNGSVPAGVRAGVGLLLLLAAGAYLRHAYREVPAPVRQYVRRRLRRSVPMTVSVLLTTTLFVLVTAMALAPLAAMSTLYGLMGSSLWSTSRRGCR